MKLKNIMENPNPCWDGYEMVGMKMKDGKEVPNCVPKNEVVEASAPGEWVVFLSTNKGKKLLKTFKSATPAKSWMKKNADKFLEKDVSIGAMTKQQWDEREAKYAIENINEGKLNAYISSNDGKTFTIYNSNKKKVKNVSKQELEKLMRVGNNYSSTMNWNEFMAKFDKTTNLGKYWKYWKGNLINVTIPSMSETKSVNELKKLPSGNFSIKVGYPTFADYEKKAKVGDTILKYDKRGGMIKNFVNGSELNQNAEKYLDKVNNITNGVVYLSKKGMKGVAQVPDYEKKEVGVLVLEAKSVNEGKWSNIMKGVRGGSQRGPWTIVVFDSGKKVIHQQPVDVRDAIPAHYEDIKRKFPNRKLSIEDNSGMIVYKESVSKKPTIKEGDCGCGGVKTSNPYSLKEFAINESKYNFGKVEYTAKNMGPVEIQDLAFAYHQTPLNKLVSKNQDTKIRVARDLGRLLGKNPMNPTEKGKESAWLLYPYKGKLINTDEYKEIYKSLTDKLKNISNSLGRGGSIGSSAAAKAAAKADMDK